MVQLITNNYKKNENFIIDNNFTNKKIINVLTFIENS